MGLQSWAPTLFLRSKKMLGDLKYPPALVPPSQMKKRKKRGGYNTGPTKREREEIEELKTKLSERDGHLKYQALLDWYRSKKR